MKNNLNYFVLDNDRVHNMLYSNNKKYMLVSLGFALGTSNLLLSSFNRDNNLDMLLYLCFASGTR